MLSLASATVLLSSLVLSTISARSIRLTDDLVPLIGQGSGTTIEELNIQQIYLDDDMYVQVQQDDCIPVMEFSDTNNHWADSYIEKARTDCMISGHEDGTFGPDESVTRAEFAAMLSKVFSLHLDDDHTIVSTLTDVATDDWFFPYLIMASKVNSIDGYDDGSFRPFQAINRAEAMKMIQGASLWLGMATVEDLFYYVEWREEFPEFTYVFYEDVSVDAWYASAVFYASLRDIVSGYWEGDVNVFRPGSTMTRAEALKILMELKRLAVPDVEGSFDEIEAMETVEWDMTDTSLWAKQVRAGARSICIYDNMLEYISRPQFILDMYWGEDAFSWFWFITESASRGMDPEELSQVFNYPPKEEHETMGYVETVQASYDLASENCELFLFDVGNVIESRLSSAADLETQMRAFYGGQLAEAIEEYMDDNGGILADLPIPIQLLRPELTCGDEETRVCKSGEACATSTGVILDELVRADYLKRLPTNPGYRTSDYTGYGVLQLIDGEVEVCPY